VQETLTNIRRKNRWVQT